MARTYTTISGDMWDYIALKTLGSEKYTNALMDANQKYINTVVFEAGIELTIPAINMKKISSLPPWKR